MQRLQQSRPQAIKVLSVIAGGAVLLLVIQFARLGFFRGDSSPISNTNGHLAVTYPIFPLRGSFLDIPKNFTRIKLDIGLSWTAPSSHLWLDRKQLPGLIVFGFEPNLSAIRLLSTEQPAAFEHPCDTEWMKFAKNHWGDRWSEVVLDHSRVGQDFYPINVALSDRGGFQTFYHTKDDPGTSSLIQPDGSKGEIATKVAYQVPVLTLSDFFDFVDWERFPLIEQVKVDAQGADLRILKGAGGYLRRVACVTPELDAPGYEGTGGQRERIVAFLEGQGFVQESKQKDGGSEEVFRNTRYESMWGELDCSTWGG